MSASVEPASTVEPTTASVESASTMECGASPEVATHEPASNCAALSEAAAPDKATAAHKARSATKGPKTRPANEAPSNERPKAWSANEGTSMEPWARADKDAAGEPAWPVVAIWRASVRVISIVAVGARGSRIHVSRDAYPHADHDSLRLCV